MPDYYEILGIPRQASGNEIKSAYRKLARKLHPDVSAHPESGEKFSQIHEAYRVLSNPQLRAIYDSKGEVGLSERKRSSDVKAQTAHFQARINRVVEQMIAEERAETRARSHAVTVLVTLFFSTFIVALMKPVLLFDMGFFWKIVAGVLFLFAIHYLFRSLRSIIERYTYIPDFPSVTKMNEPPKQPFSRRVGLAFLAFGYCLSLMLGTIGGYWFDDGSGGPYFDNYYLLNNLLLPPISVFIIHLWQFFMTKLDKVFDI